MSKIKDNYIPKDKLLKMVEVDEGEIIKVLNRYSGITEEYSKFGIRMIARAVANAKIIKVKGK